MKKYWGSFRICIVYSMLVAFLISSILPAYAQRFDVLPKPGEMVRLSAVYQPVEVKGLKVHADNPYRFDFLVDEGDSQPSSLQITAESERLVKFFMASLATPAKDLWVNLSPYEDERIIADGFGLTDMGRVLLEQDYVLRQVMSTLLYPGEKTGKNFWQRVYAKAYERFGTSDIPMDTFHKVWIVPGVARVYEDEKSNTVVIVERHLKVMLEEDYAAMASSKVSALKARHPASAQVARMSSQVMREVVLSELEREVNEGRNFASLRQVHDALILAVWYKQALKGSLLSKGYVDRKKTGGIEIGDRRIKEKVYAQYLEAFQKGAFNFIKEDVEQNTGDIIPRKYFFGGFDASQLHIVRDGRQGEARGLLKGVLHRVAVGVSPYFPGKAGVFKFGISALLVMSLMGCAALHPVDRDIVNRGAWEAESTVITVPSQTKVLSMQVYGPFMSLAKQVIQDVKISQDVRNRLKIIMGKIISSEASWGDVRLEMEGIKQDMPLETFDVLMQALAQARGVHFIPGTGGEDKEILLVVPGAQGTIENFHAVLDDADIRRDYNIAFFVYDYFDPYDGARKLSTAVEEFSKQGKGKHVNVLAHSMGTRLLEYFRFIPDEELSHVVFVALAPLTEGQVNANLLGSFGLSFVEVMLKKYDRMVPFMSKNLSYVQENVEESVKKLGSRYFEIMANGDKHMVSSAFDKAREKGYVILDTPEGLVAHMYVLSSKGIERAIAFMAGKDRQRTGAISSDAADVLKPVLASKKTDFFGKDNAQINGGIDLEGASVQARRHGKGVVLNVDGLFSFHELLEASGLAVNILSTRRVDSADVVELLGPPKG